MLIHSLSFLPFVAHSHAVMQMRRDGVRRQEDRLKFG